jgi:hypothetical protein
MTKLRASTFAFAGLLTAGLTVAPRFAAAQPAVTPPPAGGETIKSIDLPVLPPNLPDAPGRNAVVGSCTICHTPAYVTMQPPFPRKTWEATVEKMRKVYGAPVPDAVVPEIVNYLVAVRGKPDAPATRPAK